MASDFYIKLEGIDGESADKSHANWIEALSFSHGSAQTITIGRSTDVTGRGQFTPFVFTHQVDKATPKIQQYTMSGKNITKAQFHVCRAIGGSQVPVYEITMENIKVAKAEVSAQSDPEGQSQQLPVERRAGDEQPVRRFGYALVLGNCQDVGECLYIHGFLPVKCFSKIISYLPGNCNEAVRIFHHCGRYIAKKRAGRPHGTCFVDKAGRSGYY